MSDIDYLALDGKVLKLFLAVIEEGSVTGAAERLNLSQSAVSHALDRLRAIAGDPLFVKSGRCVVATAHALVLAERARVLLDGMKAFSSGSRGDPRNANLLLTVATNELHRDLLLPRFLELVRSEAPGIKLRVVPAGAPSADLLREDRCDLLLTPVPPPGADIIQKRLVDDRDVCFFDAEVRSGPRNLDEFTAAGHIIVLFDQGERMVCDRELDAARIQRDIVITVPTFSGVPVFLKGSQYLATLPSLLRFGVMRGFGWSPLPIRIPELPLYLVWHLRNHLDPTHRWLRDVMEQVAREAVQRIDGQAGAAAGKVTVKAG